MANTTETLRQIIKVDGIDKASKDINQLKGNIDNSNQSLINMGLRFVSVGVAVKTLTDSYKAFITQRDAVNKVELAINNMGLQSSITTEAVKDIASELQSLTNYGDEETLSKIFQPLILAGVDSVDTMKKIGMTILDVADGTGMGIESVSTQITGLISGASERVTELARAANISQEVIQEALRGTNTATERAIALQDVLSGKFQGTAEKSADPLKQLQNTIGDVKEELGKAFYPLIKTLADSAKSFLENENNVKSLIKTIKILTASFTGLQAIKFGGNLSNQFKNIGKELGNLDISAREMSSAIAGNKLARDFKNLNQEIYINGKRVKSIIPAFNSATQSAKLFKASLSFGKAALSLLGWVGVAYSAFTIVKQLGESFGWWGEKIESVDEKLQKNHDSIDRLITKAKEYNNLRFFTKEQLDEIKELEEEFAKLDITLDRQRLINDSNYLAEAKATAQIKANQKLLRETYLKRNEAQEKYSSILDKINKMEDSGATKDQKLLYQALQDELINTGNELNNLNNDFKTLFEKESIEIKIKTTITPTTWADLDTKSDLDKYYETVKFADKNYYNWKKTQIKIGIDEWASGLDKELHTEEEINKMRRNMFAKQLEDLDKQRNDYNKGQQKVLDKSLLSLSTYYEMVKFADKNYYDWRIKANKEESDKYVQQLVDSGYDLTEAKEEGKKLEIELNKKTNQEKLNWETLYHTTVQNLSKSTHEQALDNIAREVNAMEQLTDAEKQHLITLKQKQYIQEQQRSALASYYDTVKSLDSGYYDYKKQLIQDDIETQLEAGLITQDQSKLLAEERLNQLKMETVAYQNSAALINTAINSISSTLMESVRITAQSNNLIAKMWYNLANAIIAEIGRMITQMLVMYSLKFMLKIFDFGLGDFGGIFDNVLNFGTKSMGTSPINTVAPNPSTPIININRGSDNTIVNKLNEVINAINNNSLRTQIRTIDRIELAQEVEAGNLQRSVR